ncbi:hypothetical protein FALBO_1099 [Fusarium albosuccineum]|uniref:Uncharacterized protein n=1 Tax=Fusarium albosuccineum TaxID=1237068 RepID=A0A8H4LMB4_9HYPO|nr:hypothetical protein FALBO_1099 [Fusarium albosuccineum]
MPSLTEYFGYTVTNLGPLTTTYTPPAACTTQTTDGVYFANASHIDIALGQPSCGIPSAGKCVPSGSALDKLREPFDETPQQGFFYYHSPGVVCPSGWTTAGTLAHANKTGTGDEAGVMTKDSFEGLSTKNAEMQLDPKDVWLEILEKDETLAGWTGGPRGGCFSSIGPFESYSYSRRCIQYYPKSAVKYVTDVEGTYMSKAIVSIASVTETFTAETETLTDFVEPTELADWAVVKWLPAIPLVYKEDDVADAKEDGEEDGEGNAASALSAARGVAPVVAVVVGLLAGAGLLMPW